MLSRRHPGVIVAYWCLTSPAPGCEPSASDGPAGSGEVPEAEVCSRLTGPMPCPRRLAWSMPAALGIPSEHAGRIAANTGGPVPVRIDLVAAGPDTHHETVIHRVPSPPARRAIHPPPPLARSAWGEVVKRAGGSTWNCFGNCGIRGWRFALSTDVSDPESLRRWLLLLHRRTRDPFLLH